MKSYIESALSYREYRKTIDQLLENQKTSGSNHSADMIHFTKMNVRRMNRLDKKPEILTAVRGQIQEVAHPVSLLILTEAWCGDAAQIIPVIERIVQENDLIQTHYIWRDENLELMDQFQTDGGRGIPKVLFIDPSRFEVFGSWGPRPEEAQNLVRAYKANPTVPYLEFAERLHKWYAMDKTIQIQNEFTGAFTQAIKKLPSELGS
jgi:hypothetical protein